MLAGITMKKKQQQQQQPLSRLRRRKQKRQPLAHIFLLFLVRAFLLSPVLALVTVFAFCPKLVSPKWQRKHAQIKHRFFNIAAPLQANANNENRNNEDADKFRASAQRLRDEAEVLESQMDRKTPSRGVEPVSPAVYYTSLKDSIWTLTYRFASDPPNDNDNNDDDNKKGQTNKPVAMANTFYSGKMTIQLLSNGYTKLLRHEPTGKDRFQLLKVWRWDQEMGDQDDQTYVLFSTNLQIPATDTAVPNEELRCYWQARVDTSTDNASIDTPPTASKGALRLVDGTVTVKKDVKPPGGTWGFFNGGGILAQFRYVGNFAAKAATVASATDEWETTEELQQKGQRFFFIIWIHCSACIKSSIILWREKRTVFGGMSMPEEDWHWHRSNE